MTTSARLLAPHRPVHRAAADFLGQPGGAFVMAIADRQMAPRRVSPNAIARATPPAPRINTCLSNSGLGSSSLVGPPSRLRANPSPRDSRCYSRHACRLPERRPCCNSPFVRPPPLSAAKGDDRLLVGDRHAATLQVEPEQLFEKGRQLTIRDQERHHDLVQTKLAEGGVVHHRAHTLLDRVTDNAIDLGCGVDLVEAEIVLEHAIMEHPRGENSLGIETRVGKGCADTWGQGSG